MAACWALLQRLGEQLVRAVRALVRPQVPAVLEVQRVHAGERHELGDLHRLGGGLLERLQLLGGEEHVLVTRELVALDQVVAGHDLVVHRAPELLLDAALALVVELVERDLRRALGRRVELHRDVHQAEGDGPRADRASRHDSVDIPPSAWPPADVRLATGLSRPRPSAARRADRRTRTGGPPGGRGLPARQPAPPAPFTRKRMVVRAEVRRVPHPRRAPRKAGPAPLPRRKRPLGAVPRGGRVAPRAPLGRLHPRRRGGGRGLRGQSLLQPPPAARPAGTPPRRGAARPPTGPSISSPPRGTTCAGSRSPVAGSCSRLLTARRRPRPLRRAGGDRGGGLLRGGEADGPGGHRRQALRRCPPRRPRRRLAEGRHPPGRGFRRGGPHPGPHLARPRHLGRRRSSSTPAGWAAGSRRARRPGWSASSPRTAAPTPPCRDAPRDRDLVWVDPTLVAEVRYKEWERGGSPRAPVFCRFRDDRRPEQCLPPWRAEERTVNFVNLEKLWFPEDGFTKGDLIRYYQAIAPVDAAVPARPAADAHPVPRRHPRRELLPEAGRRSLRALLGPHRGDGGRRGTHPAVRLRGRGDALLPGQPRHHPLPPLERAGRGSRASRLVHPRPRPQERALRARASPSPSPRGRCARSSSCRTSSRPAAARVCTSSSPWSGSWTTAAAISFGQVLAEALVQQHPDIATTERVVRARRSKVYVDYLQNGRGKLLAAPFSARPLPGAPVSMPLRWDEVRPGLHPTAVHRAGRRRRAWSGSGPIPSWACSARRRTWWPCSRASDLPREARRSLGSGRRSHADRPLGRPPQGGRRGPAWPGRGRCLATGSTARGKSSSVSPPLSSSGARPASPAGAARPPGPRGRRRRPPR